MTFHQKPQDSQTPQARKVENDHNKQGDQPATQIHQGQRTPDSRSDRESHVGSHNQSQERRHPGGAGH